MIWSEAVDLSRKSLAKRIETKNRRRAYWHYVDEHGRITSYVEVKNNFFPVSISNTEENLKCLDWEPIDPV